ncbi:hypothetical protein ANN_03616 [Periplaneta americana]|uniref:Uncharacterized protein n=1 Tax=Periplaneta americana TaxID=6978 RepID=A0ABQ8U560_PERAM|nr:hypothetical protein ANN_03616 [Periplaneta americana]
MALEIPKNYYNSSSKLGTWGLVSLHVAKRPDFNVNKLPLPVRSSEENLDDEEDAECIFCQENIHSISASGEGWARCMSCMKWAHEEFPGLDPAADDDFTCEMNELFNFSGAFPLSAEVWGKPGKKLNQVISPSKNLTHARTQLWIGKQTLSGITSVASRHINHPWRKQVFSFPEEQTCLRLVDPCLAGRRYALREYHMNRPGPPPDRPAAITRDSTCDAIMSRLGRILLCALEAADFGIHTADMPQLVVNRNVGLKDLRTASDILAGKNTDLQSNIPIQLVSKLKYAPVTSLDVERSFSDTNLC